MILTVQPYAYQGTGNPIILRGTKQPAYESVAIIAITAGGVSSTFTRDFLNDVASFNISKFLQAQFVDQRTTVLANLVFKDSNLYFDYTVKYMLSGVERTLKSIAVNAVKQDRGIYGIMPTGYYRTKFKKVVKYGWLPLTVTAHLGLDTTTPLYIDGNLAVAVGSGNTFVDVQIIKSTVGANTNLSIGNPASGLTPASAKMNIETVCLPEKYIYLRWINDLGGWSYYLFTKGFENEQSISGITSFRGIYTPTTMTISDAYRDAGMITGAEIAETITVGADNITTDDFNALRDILGSPKIQIYRGVKSATVDLLAWDTVILSGNARVRENPVSVRQSIEYKLSLQPLNTRYYNE